MRSTATDKRAMDEAREHFTEEEIKSYLERPDLFKLFATLKLAMDMVGEHLTEEQIKYFLERPKLFKLWVVDQMLTVYEAEMKKQTAA